MLGQEHITSALRDAAARDALHHAYLFVGPPGSGKREMALWLARLANCEGEGDRPCGVCSQCHLIAAGNHPDVSWIGPDQESKKGHITIRQAQAVRVEISRRPVVGRRKVVFLDPADEMTLDAVNCLLKTFEEPPDYATLVLLVGDTTTVIPTVLSRCQVARFKPAPQHAIAEYLEKEGAEPGQAAHIARLADGRPGEALRLLRDPDALTTRDRSIAWLESVSLASHADALYLAEDFRSGTEDVAADVPGALRWASTWFRDIAILQSGASTGLVVNTDRMPSLTRAANIYSSAQAVTAMDSIVQARRFLAGNGSASLVTECLLMDLIPWRGAR